MPCCPTEAGDNYQDGSSLSYDEPYEALRNVTVQGHVNAMLDGDRVLRHSLLAIELSNGRRAPSFVLAVAQKYAEAKGQPETVPPEKDRRGFWYLPYTGLPGAGSASAPCCRDRASSCGCCGCRWEPPTSIWAVWWLIIYSRCWRSAR